MSSAPSACSIGKTKNFGDCMKINANKIWPLALMTILVLSACGPSTPEATPVDPSAIFTAAAETVAAQLTQTAMAFTPTSQPTATQPPVTDTPATQGTPAGIPTIGSPVAGSPTAGFPTVGIPTAGLPGITSTPGAPPPSGDVCDNSAFAGYSNFYGLTDMDPGEDFEKIWRVQNTGICTWDDGYYLAFAFGNEKLDGPGWKITKTTDFVAPGETKDIGMQMTAPLKPGEYNSCWQMVNDRGVAFGEVFCVYIRVVKP
jgi:hypothetical protein